MWNLPSDSAGLNGFSFRTNDSMNDPSKDTKGGFAEDKDKEASKPLKNDASSRSVQSRRAHRLFNSDDCERFLRSGLPGGARFLSKDAVPARKTGPPLVLNWDQQRNHFQGGYVLTTKAEDDALFLPGRSTEASVASNPPSDSTIIGVDSRKEQPRKRKSIIEEREITKRQQRPTESDDNSTMSSSKIKQANRKAATHSKLPAREKASGDSSKDCQSADDADKGTSQDNTRQGQEPE